MTAIAKRFETFADWTEFNAQNPWIMSPEFITSVIEKARKDGLSSVAFGQVAPESIEIVGENWRETISVSGCSSRVRAVFDMILSEPEVTSFSRILMLEAVTPFALHIRGRFPMSLGVEYLLTEKDRDAWFPIQHCDIENPPFDADRFDVVVSNDVLEHVADLDAGLAGMAKVLKPGGIMISTIPFIYTQHKTIEKAKLVDGKIEHFGEPEYHGNPIDPEGGSLVFNLPGWDIIERCRAAGFSDAAMIFVADTERAITGAEIAGVHVLRCVK